MSAPTPITTVKGGLTDSLPDERSCQLLGPTALVVQGILGVLVILSLVYKRHRETRKRPWRIWLFDVSKQVVGQMFVHGTNVLLSDLVSHHGSANACVFYFLHILIDTTLGVAALYVILRALTHVFSEKLGFKGFVSGVYGNPPSFKLWARQAAIYVMSLTTMKLLVIAILVLFPGIFYVGEWLLSWTRVGEGDSVQVIFVMGVFPIMMNIIQFWLIDSIVKASGSPSVALEGDNSDIYATQDREPLFQAPSDDEDDSDHRPGDIENARTRHSRSPQVRDTRYKRSTRSSTPEERKSYPASSSSDHIGHSYPPSLTSSMSSSQGIQPKPAKDVNNKANRRGAPTPLSINNKNPPAVNALSSGGPFIQGTLPHVPLVPIVAPNPKAPAQHGPHDSWAATWEDSDDWANRVGEEDGTERRLDQMRDGLHGTLGSSAIQVA